uniref:Uncharacterized protein n=1 Tax=Anguilla anguilla TaxID=7936 RepID=A0A0E9RCE2_ANGAN
MALCREHHYENFLLIYFLACGNKISVAGSRIPHLLSLYLLIETLLVLYWCMNFKYLFIYYLI